MEARNSLNTKNVKFTLVLWGKNTLNKRYRRQTDKQKNRQADKQTSRQADKQTNRQTDKQTNRQTDRQFNPLGYLTNALIVVRHPLLFNLFYLRTENLLLMRI